MANLQFYSLVLFLFVLCIERSSAQFSLISCYQCTNCSDPFSASASNASISTQCNACYKLSVDIAYAPYRYVIRKCVRACLETTQSFAGGLITSSCCSTGLCNGSSMVKFSGLSRLFLLGLFLYHFLKRYFL